MRSIGQFPDILYIFGIEMVDFETSPLQISQARPLSTLTFHWLITEPTHLFNSMRFRFIKYLVNI